MRADLPGNSPVGTRWRTLLWPGLATLVALAILVSLGIWQLERKAWKEGLIRQIESRAYAEPGEAAPESAWASWNPADGEYRRIRISGTFLPDAIVPVHGLAEERRGQALLGFYLFEPLRLRDGAVVVVNRGFVPSEQLAPTLAVLRSDGGAASVTGLVRTPQPRAPFQPENDPGRGEWYVRSIDDMARHFRLGRVAPFYVDADATPNPGGWPRGGQTELTLRNAHLEYALTWFGIAITLLGVFAAYARGRRHLNSRPGGQSSSFDPDTADPDVETVAGR